MHAFPESLNVDCSYCPRSGRNRSISEANPRKDIARNMILLVRQDQKQKLPDTGGIPNEHAGVTA
jgi:hypothetical protein